MKEFLRKTLCFFCLLGLVWLILTGCASTLRQTGKTFKYQPGAIIKHQTTKGEVLSAYGRPASSQIKGKYEVLKYYHEKKSLKHGRSIGMGLLSAIPLVGFAALAMDQGVKDSDIKNEFQEMKVFVELSTGLVRDYYYHDSRLKGHDKSETLFLEAQSLLKQGKTDQAVKLLKKSISLNPKNHRALNTLAWTLIDLNIDLHQGITYAKEAVKIWPDSPYNNSTLGHGYFKNWNFIQAEKYLKIAMSLYPVYASHDPKALMHDRAILNAIQAQKNNLSPP